MSPIPFIESDIDRVEAYGTLKGISTPMSKKPWASSFFAASLLLLLHPLALV